MGEKAQDQIKRLLSLATSDAPEPRAKKSTIMGGAEGSEEVPVDLVLVAIAALSKKVRPTGKQHAKFRKADE